MNTNRHRFYLVDASMLPEIFLRVMEAKELLQTGEAETVADAAARVGISRSAFYKYKDSITPFQDLKRGRILTFHVVLLDQPGVLSAVLGIFAQCGANILTVNQSIPVDGVANVTVAADTAEMSTQTDEMLHLLQTAQGVVRAGVLAG